ncbi:MAG: hypothetical protein ACK5KR_04630 [Breznakia sp.]
MKRILVGLRNFCIYAGMIFFITGIVLQMIPRYLLYIEGLARLGKGYLILSMTFFAVVIVIQLYYYPPKKK